MHRLLQRLGSSFRGVPSPSGNPPPGDGAIINPATGSITGGVGGTTYFVEYTTGGACPTTSMPMPVNGRGFRHLLQFVRLGQLMLPHIQAQLPSGCWSVVGLLGSGFGITFLKGIGFLKIGVGTFVGKMG